MHRNIKNTVKQNREPPKKIHTHEMLIYDRADFVDGLGKKSLE